MRAGLFLVDIARHFFSFLLASFALGIATYFVWPSEPGLHYLAALPVFLAVGRVTSLSALAGIFELYAKSAMIFCICLIRSTGCAGRRKFPVRAAACRFPACPIDLSAEVQSALLTDARHLSVTCGSVDVEFRLIFVPATHARHILMTAGPWNHLRRRLFI